MLDLKMKIAHIDFSGTFNEDMTYQENMIAKYNVADGHQVLVITTCYLWDNEGKIVKIREESKVSADGYSLVRLEYRHLFNEFISRKIRDIDRGKLIGILDAFSPEIVILHCFQTRAIKYITSYCGQHRIKFVVDTHSNFYNSARGILSKYLLHRFLYRRWLLRAYDFIDRIYYIGYEEKEFMNKVYRIQDDKMRYLPLGGVVLPNHSLKSIREKVRRALAITGDEVVFVVAGKFDQNKRLGDVISSFVSANVEARLLIVGSIDTTEMEGIDRWLSASEKILYLGFRTGDELNSILCSGDVYIQAFNISAIAQNAICAGCALILKDTTTYRSLIDTNGFLVNNTDQLVNAIRCCMNVANLDAMKARSLELAREQYDYKVIARKIIS